MFISQSRLNAVLISVLDECRVFRMDVPSGDGVQLRYPLAIWARNGGQTLGDFDGGAPYQSIRITVLGRDYDEVDRVMQRIVAALKAQGIIENDPAPPTDVLHEDLDTLGSETTVLIQ